MKNIIIALIAIMAVAGIVQAAGPLPESADRVSIQGHMPNSATYRNDSKTGTKNFQVISTASWNSMKVVVTDGSGNTKPFKYKPNSQTAYMPVPSGEETIIIPYGAINFRLEGYSTASSTTMFNTSRSATR